MNTIDTLLGELLYGQNNTMTQLDDDEDNEFDILNTTLVVPETPSLDEMNRTLVVPETPSLDEEEIYDPNDPANFMDGHVGCHGCSFRVWGYNNMGLSQREHMEWPNGCLCYKEDEEDDKENNSDTEGEKENGVKKSLIKILKQDAITQIRNTNEASTQTDENEVTQTVHKRIRFV